MALNAEVLPALRGETLEHGYDGGGLGNGVREKLQIARAVGGGFMAARFLELWPLRAAVLLVFAQVRGAREAGVFDKMASRSLSSVPEVYEGRRAFLSLLFDPRHAVRALKKDEETQALGIGMVLGSCDENTPVPRVPISTEEAEETPEPEPVPTPWVEQMEVAPDCVEAVGIALTVCVHMLGPNHVWGRELALYDPSEVAYPDHVVNVLYQYGYTPESLIRKLIECLPAAYIGHDHSQYRFRWPEWLKRDSRSEWGEGRGQRGYDGSRYWEKKRFWLVPAPKPLPFYHPEPGQHGPNEVEKRWLSPETGLAMAELSIVAEVELLGMATTVGVVVAPEELIAFVPYTVSQLPSNFWEQIIGALEAVQPTIP